MPVFESVLALLLVAALLAMAARRLDLPYPTLLAVGGVLVALLPGTPQLDLPPDLILALFVAPVLLDAAHDTSLRDLRANWAPVLSLVLIAVGLTTIAVAAVARYFLPEMPWAAAIALGALVAPPDAVAALAVLRHVVPPDRIRTILEGESLLNDASSLLIYKLAVGVVAVGSFSVAEAMPTLALVTLGSVAAGGLLALIATRLLAPVDDPPTAIILQFVATFGVWIVAEQLGLSGVITLVVYGLTVARRHTSSATSQVRLLSNATWSVATFVLNVLAFTLIGLQVRPVLEGIGSVDRVRQIGIALAILGVVVVVRLGWVFFYGFVKDRTSSADPAVNFKSRLMVGWSGMRGMVTLAAALALPISFPFRDFILLTAFAVVLGTLVVQGLTLRPLLRWLKLPSDSKLDDELSTARSAALVAAMTELDRHEGPARERLRLEYREALTEARDGRDPRGSSDNLLRQQVVPAARRAIDALRDGGQIGDEAYRTVERELDLLELSSRLV